MLAEKGLRRGTDSRDRDDVEKAEVLQSHVASARAICVGRFATWRNEMDCVQDDPELARATPSTAI